MPFPFFEIKQQRCLLFLSFIVGFSSTNVCAGVPNESVLMPKASKSLLLDIDKISEKIVVVGERGHILVSNDQGQTWVQSRVPTVQMLNAVDFVTERSGWAVGHDGNILNSKDGGETWNFQRDGLKAQHENNIQALSAAKARIKELELKLEENTVAEIKEPEVAEISSDENIEAPLTLDEQLDEAKDQLEVAQERLEGQVIAPPLMDVWFADELNGWAVGAFGTLLKTVDGGKVWLDQSKHLNNPDGYHLNAIIGVGGRIFIAGESGFLSTSSDNGETWSNGDLGYDGTIFGLFASHEGSFVVATGLRGNTFRTQDSGLTWQPITPGINYSLSSGAVYESTHIILVGTGGSIAISNDKGDTFKQYILPSRSSLSSVIVLDEGQFLLVGQGGVHHFDIKQIAK